MSSSPLTPPDPVSAPRFGAVLRARRRELALTLDAVAAATGLTKGFVSEVERDQASLSVASLVRLCEVLGLRVGSLFEAASSPAVVRVAERTPIRFGGIGIVDHLLSSHSAKRLQVILSAMRPLGSGGEELYAIPAEEEFVLVLEGACTLTVESTIVRLQTGDAMTFDPRLPHTFANPSAERDALVLFVVTPARY